MTRSDFLDVDRIERALPEECSLGPILVEERLASTNTTLLDGARDGVFAPGTVLAAEEQTAGRGRLDRAWSADRGKSLTFSVFVENPLPSRPGFVSIGSALSVAKAIEDLTAIETAIKWPNDIYVGEGKVAGILAEGFQSGGIFYVVVGMGVNVNSTPEIAHTGPVQKVTSIFQATGHSTDRSALLARIITHFHDTMALLTDSRRIGVARGLQRRSFLVGRHVRLARSGAFYEGTLQKHTDDLGLVIAGSDGEIVLPGEGTDLVDFC